MTQSANELFELMFAETNDLVLYLEMKCDSPAEHEPLAKACCKWIDEYSFKIA